MEEEQGSLCLERPAPRSHEMTAASSTFHPAVVSRKKAPSRQSIARSKVQRTLQDVLLVEGVLAVQLAAQLDSLTVLHDQLLDRLPQNSLETRSRYIRSLLKWFFPDGVASLACHVWTAYHDESIVVDLLRYLYLTAEPLMGTCVAEVLYPLEEGIRIPAHYFERFLRERLPGEPAPKTCRRLKTNLMKLGFLARARGKPDRLQPVVPTATAFLILLHHLFAPHSPRTVEMRTLFANPFWQYLGFKSEDAVRTVLRRADAAGMLGKYVVADQLELITTCVTLDEILTRKVRL